MCACACVGGGEGRTRRPIRAASHCESPARPAAAHRKEGLWLSHMGYSGEYSRRWAPSHDRPSTYGRNSIRRKRNSSNRGIGPAPYSEYSGYSGSTCTKSASTSSSTRANGSLVVVRFSSSKTYATFITQHARQSGSDARRRTRPLAPPIARRRRDEQTHKPTQLDKQTNKQTRKSWRGPRRQADSHFLAQTVLASAANGSRGLPGRSARACARGARL